MALRLLLVEDDIDLANGIIDFLALSKIECDYASTGRIGLNLSLKNSYDLIILDINIPQVSGFTLCTKIRQQGLDTPILMLTAMDTVEDKLKGFECGTDDYLVKPFNIHELLARVKSLSKRRSTQIKKLSIADFSMDLSLKTVTRAGKNIELSAIGWTIIETLLRESPNVVTKEELEEMIWHGDPPGNSALKVHIFRLRDKVDKPFKFPLIHTVTNYGFAMRINCDD